MTEKLLNFHTVSLKSITSRFFQGVLKERGRASWNPLDKNNQGNTEVLNKILTNTVEQFLMFASSTIILSTYLESGQMKLIFSFIIQWCLGRFLFEFG